MDEKEYLKERFKSAISSAVKAISENFEIEVKFGNNIPSKKNYLSLPEISNLDELQDFTNLRAFADSEALKIKYSNKEVYQENEPNGLTGKELYSIAEKIRCEKIGSDNLRGIKNNIIMCYENKIKNKKIEQINSKDDVPIAEAFELYLRNHFFQIKQNSNNKKMLSYWKDLFERNLSKKLVKLSDNIKNQKEFSELAADLISKLDFEDLENKNEESEEDSSKKDEFSENKQEKNEPQEDNEKSDNSELNSMESSLESANDIDESEQKEQKEINGDPSIKKSIQNSLLKEKFYHNTCCFLRLILDMSSMAFLI